ncbi:MAG: hypothetical protein AABY18_08815 [Candidatus Thermoplasmatota archaeon]
MAAVNASALTLLATAVLVAGCSGGAGNGDAAPESGSDDVLDGGLTLPTWAVRDWWQYGIEAGAGEESPPTTYVVTADAGADWFIDTDSEERAFQDARDDISRLGPQRKSDLAGSQGDDRVEFFRWPLRAGANWTTRWDHQPVDIAVASVDGSRATLTARNATQVVYTYTYDADVRWFRQLDRHGPDGGVAFSLMLLDHGVNWTGTAVRWELETLATDGTAGNAGPGALQIIPGLSVSAGTTDLWLAYGIPCSQGAFSVTLRSDADPGQGGYDVTGQCAGSIAFSEVAVQSPSPGTWTLTFGFATTPGDGPMEYELLARTRVDVPVG